MFIYFSLKEFLEIFLHCSLVLPNFPNLEQSPGNRLCDHYEIYLRSYIVLLSGHFLLKISLCWFWIMNEFRSFLLDVIIVEGGTITILMYSLRLSTWTVLFFCDCFLFKLKNSKWVYDHIAISIIVLDRIEKMRIVVNNLRHLTLVGVLDLVFCN